MDSKTLSPQAMGVIDQYLHFKLGSGVCSVPYFNNKTTRSRSALNALVGKGSPKEIYEEAETHIFKSHIKTDDITNEGLKKLLADRNIGIDCSALAYYILDAESQAQGKGALKKNLNFIQAKGIKGFIASRTHPARLADVATFVDDQNSRPVELHEAIAGDIITMMDSSEAGERNHILIIHRIDYTGAVPSKLYYSHAVAYPEDGLYGSGVRQGEIEISKAGEPITLQKWTEAGKEGPDNRIFTRVQKSKTELRRLKWL